MSLVFEINQELASVSVTATELLSITRAVTELIKNQSFRTAFNDIVAEINQSYGVVEESFLPFHEIDNEERFARLFPERHAAFKGRYLLDVSKPRKYCDNVYDAYLQMRQTKQAKSSFPPLQQTFARLDGFYDKWITNDAFLAMSIDGALKLESRLLNEVAEFNKKDTEHAYDVFASAFDDFADYVALIQAKREAIATLTAMERLVQAIPATGA